MDGIFFKQTFTTSIKILVDLLKGVTNNDGIVSANDCTYDGIRVLLSGIGLVHVQKQISRIQ